MISIGQSDEGDFQLSPFQHMAIMGIPGSGKSKLILLLLQWLLLNGIGFAMIDGAKDLFDDLCAWSFKKRLPPGTKEKVFIFRPSTDMNVSLNLFDPKGRTGSKRIAWWRARVRKLARDIIRGGGEYSFNEMRRLERHLTNVLYAVSAEYEPGKTIGLDHALDVLDVGHKHWEDAFSKVVPFLPVEIVRDFIWLRRMSDSARFDELSSTISRLRSFLSDIVRSMLASDKPALDISGIVQSGGIILADMSTTAEFSREESVICAGLLMTEIADAKETGDHDTPYIVAIDEFGRFVGEDTGDWLLAARHWNLFFWMGFQTITTLIR